MKRFFAAVLTAGLLVFQMPAVCAVGTSASSAILMDAGSGRVLYEQNAREPRLIASITKLMTALVALESGHELNEPVTIQPEWAGVEGSSIYLRAGEQVALETLLYGMLLRSGNDAALAVAGCCGGTVEAFVDRMNETAQRLGMKDSHFANPNGLNAEGHYSSAYDMALLAKACLENETLAKIVSTKTITLGTRTFTNHNKLLWRYEGCVGMKTGYTEKAGRTLVSAAQREGMTLVCVTLNDGDDWNDHMALFDHGFAAYHMVTAVQSGQRLLAVPVRGGTERQVMLAAVEDLRYPVTGEEQLTVVARAPAWVAAPVVPGQEIGRVCAYLDGEEVAQVPLVAAQPAAAVEDEAGAPGLFQRIFGRTMREQ